MVLVIVVHTLVPRYEYQLAGVGGLAWVRVDRWTGQAIGPRKSPDSLRSPGASTAPPSSAALRPFG